MSASVNILSPINRPLATPRGKAGPDPEKGGTSTPLVQRGRINQQILDELADQAMVELKRRNGVRFPQRSSRLFERWVDDVVVKEAGYGFGRILHARVVRAVVQRLTGRDRPKVIGAEAKDGSVRYRLTEEGKRYLLARAKQAHPATGSNKVIRD